MLVPFCNLTNLFLLLYKDPVYEVNFWNELYACVQYLGFRLDEVMHLPVYIRRLWMNKNRERAQAANSNQNGTTTIGNAMINSYAKRDQGNKKKGLAM